MTKIELENIRDILEELIQDNIIEIGRMEEDVGKGECDNKTISYVRGINKGLEKGLQIIVNSYKESFTK